MSEIAFQVAAKFNLPRAVTCLNLKGIYKRT